MKILAVADLHGDISLAKALAKKAEQEQVDTVILCGDIVASDESPEGIVGQFTKKNKRVILLPGNHESLATINFLSELYSATNLHAYSMYIGGKKEIGIFGCGFANMGPFGLPDQEIHAILKKGFNYIKGAKKKIMITHAHPSGTLMEKLSQFIPGSEGVQKAVEELQPDILLCGHVHEAEGIEEKLGNTLIINVSRKGKVIEI